MKHDWDLVLAFVSEICCHPSKAPAELQMNELDDVIMMLKEYVNTSLKGGDTMLEALIGSKAVNKRRLDCGLCPIRPKVVDMRLRWVLTDVSGLLSRTVAPTTPTMLALPGTSTTALTPKLPGRQ